MAGVKRVRTRAKAMVRDIELWQGLRGVGLGPRPWLGSEVNSMCACIQGSTVVETFFLV